MEGISQVEGIPQDATYSSGGTGSQSVVIHPAPHTNHPNQSANQARDITRRIAYMVRLHISLAQAEAILFAGVIPSVFRGAISICEIAGGLLGFGIGGGFYCIPCPVDQGCTRVFAGMQLSGQVQINLGVSGLVDSLMNIGTVTLYQTNCGLRESGHLEVFGHTSYYHNRSGAERVLQGVEGLLEP